MFGWMGKSLSRDGFLECGRGDMCSRSSDIRTGFLSHFLSPDCNDFLHNDVALG